MTTRLEEKERRRAERVAKEAAMAKTSEPKCIEISVQHSGGGKVSIRDYGAIQSNWGLSMSRRFEIPEDWTQKQIDEFQLAEHDRLHLLIEPLDQAEFDERAAQIA
jgi:hypothetical protein